MNTYFQVLLVSIGLLCPGSSHAQVLPEKAPPVWTLTVRTYGTTSLERQPHNQIFLYTSGGTPSVLNAVRRNNIAQPKLPGFKRTMSEAEMSAIYDLTRRAFLTYKVDDYSGPQVADGTSIDIRFTTARRSIEIGVDHNGDISAAMADLLKSLNAFLPGDYVLPWEGISEIIEKRKKEINKGKEASKP